VKLTISFYIAAREKTLGARFFTLSVFGRKIGVIFTFRKLRDMSAGFQTSRSTFMAPLASPLQLTMLRAKQTKK
jgi:hypothetical protein